MATFDARCREAIELAKRSLDASEPLEVGPLLDALYHIAELQSKADFQDLSGTFPEPKPQRTTVGSVPLGPNLKPLINSLPDGKPVTPIDLFAFLVRSDAGQQWLRSRNLNEDRLSKLLRQLPGAPAVRAGRGEKQRQQIEGFQNFGRVLTEPPGPNLHGELDPKIWGLDRLILPLMTPRVRSVLLVGPPGVGKSMLVNLLAHRILEGDPSLPEMIREMDIVELSPGFPRGSGTDINADRDAARILSLLRYLESASNVLFFVDRLFAFLAVLHRVSLHQELVSAFLETLMTGKVACVGAVVPDEYTKLAQFDGSLPRRFNTVHLKPMGAAETERILRGRVKQLEAHFPFVGIPDALLPDVVDLAERYLPERHQPEKSIRLLENACTVTLLGNTTPVTEKTPLQKRALVQAVEKMAGPVLLSEQNLTVNEVSVDLKKAIVGQDAILDQLAEGIVASRNDDSGLLWRGPRGVFLFAGPTGVGKTETALRVARLLGGGREALIRIDCQNLQGSGSGWEAHSVIWRLLGVAPGYVGYTPGCRDGLLVKVREVPEGVLLLDEFEKADNAVGKVLLRILDEGKGVDSEGNELDFRRCLVILTTNAGVTYRTPFGFPSGTGDGMGPRTSTEDLQEEILSTGLGREFLARIQQKFVFGNLSKADIREVLVRKLGDLKTILIGQGRELTWTDAFCDRVVSRWKQDEGVRFLMTLVETAVVNQVRIASVQKDLDGVTSIKLDAATDKLEDSLIFRARRERRNDTLEILL